jgi:hypothetical protein
MGIRPIKDFFILIIITSASANSHGFRKTTFYQFGGGL